MVFSERLHHFQYASPEGDSMLEMTAGTPPTRSKLYNILNGDLFGKDSRQVANFSRKEKDAAIALQATATQRLSKIVDSGDIDVAMVTPMQNLFYHLPQSL